MADNTELIEDLNKLVASYITRLPGLPGDEAEMLESDAAIIQMAANALEEAAAEITTLTEFVESVRHIETMKALMKAKVKKLQAMNRRGK